MQKDSLFVLVHEPYLKANCRKGNVLISTGFVDDLGEYTFYVVNCSCSDCKMPYYIGKEDIPKCLVPIPENLAKVLYT